MRAFDEGAERKYQQVREFVVPGRIVDVGCCTGAILRQMTLDQRLRESDFYGVEVAATLYRECVFRKEQGYFANPNVFFYQRNIVVRPLFPPASVNTFTKFSSVGRNKNVGGMARASLCVLKAVRMIHSTGKK